MVQTTILKTISSKRRCWWSRDASSVQFSCSVMSNSLQRHGLQHDRLPCPSPTPRTCSNARPSSQWCHPTISSSVIPFSSCPQSFPAQGCAPWGAYLSLSPIFPYILALFEVIFLICSFLLFREFFDGQKLVILINWSVFSFMVCTSVSIFFF